MASEVSAESGFYSTRSFPSSLPSTASFIDEYDPCIAADNIAIEGPIQFRNFQTKHQGNDGGPCDAEITMSGQTHLAQVLYEGPFPSNTRTPTAQVSSHQMLHHQSAPFAQNRPAMSSACSCCSPVYVPQRIAPSQISKSCSMIASPTYTFEGGYQSAAMQDHCHCQCSSTISQSVNMTFRNQALPPRFAQHRTLHRTQSHGEMYSRPSDLAHIHGTTCSHHLSNSLDGLSRVGVPDMHSRTLIEEIPSHLLRRELVTGTAVVAGPAPHNKKSDLYKTELCRSWTETATCRYGWRCQFAHGLAELQPMRPPHARMAPTSAYVHSATGMRLGSASATVEYI